MTEEKLPISEKLKVLERYLIQRQTSGGLQ